MAGVLLLVEVVQLLVQLVMLALVLDEASRGKGIIDVHEVERQTIERLHKAAADSQSGR